MATTTPGAIRDVLITLVAAAVPDLHPVDRFVAYREDTAGADDFRTWAEANPAACLRRFSIMYRHDVTIPDVCDGNIERVRQTFDVEVSWPAQSNRYRDRRGMADVIAADMRKIRGTIGYAGFPLTYPQHGSLCTVRSESPDLVQRGRAVTVGSLELVVEYWRDLL